MIRVSYICVDLPTKTSLGLMNGYSKTGVALCSRAKAKK